MARITVEDCLKNVKNGKERASSGEKYVIRLNIKPKQTIEFEDLIRGKISFQSENIDDQILIKSDGYPTYHLAVVVDDHLMEISHVIRGLQTLSEEIGEVGFSLHDLKQMKEEGRK